MNPSIRPCHEGIEEYTPEEVRESVREAVGSSVRGAAFPTAVKPPERSNHRCCGSQRRRVRTPPDRPPSHARESGRRDSQGRGRSREDDRRGKGDPCRYRGEQGRRSTSEPKGQRLPHVHVEAVRPSTSRREDAHQGALEQRGPLRRTPLQRRRNRSKRGKPSNVVYDSLTTGMPLIKRGLTISGMGSPNPPTWRSPSGPSSRTWIEGAAATKAT